jgi:acetyl esterase/lipase
MKRLVELGHYCATVDYRMAGVDIYSQIIDVRKGYDIFFTHLKEKGIEPKVVCWGSSAGAHLAALTALANPGECGEDVDNEYYSPDNEWIKPAGLVTQALPVYFHPWEDIFPGIWLSMENIVGVKYESNQAKYKKLEPMHYVRQEACPSFILNAECEHMFPNEYVEDFVEKMKSCGVNASCKLYTKAEHGFFYNLTRRQQKEAFADVLEFVKGL